MGVGHEGTKIYKKWQKQVTAVALLQLHDEDSLLFSSPCTITVLILEIHGKEKYRESSQKARKGDKIRCSWLRLVSHLSKLFGLVRDV